VASDNAKTAEWGFETEDEHGALLVNLMAELDYHVVNEGRSYTFVRDNTGSVVDVAFASSTLLASIGEWRVTEQETHSDHRYIRYDIKGSGHA